MASKEKVPEASETDNTNIGSEDKIMYSILEGTLKNGIQIDENSKKIDQIITILSKIMPYNWHDKSPFNKMIGKFYSKAQERIGMDFETLNPGWRSGGRKSRKKRKTKRKRKGRKRKSRRRR